MGKNHKCAVVLRIWLKFWWMIPMGVRENHTKYEPETHGDGQEHLSQVADLGFKNCNLGPKTAIFGPKEP